MSKAFATAALRHDRFAHLPVHLLRTRDGSGESCYFVVRASHASYKALLASGKTVNIADYGQILASGFGAPNLQIRRRLKQEWGIELPEDC